MSLITRKNITRSRNGCAVCKSKRLKCDEARPSCSRCERLGIPCPGYKKPLKWPTSSPSPANQARTSSFVVQSPSTDAIAGLTFDHQDPVNEATPYLDSPGFSELLTDIMGTEGSGIDEPGSLESPSLAFMEPLGNPQLAIDVVPGILSPSEHREETPNELWDGTSLSITQPQQARGVVQRRTPPKRLSASHTDLSLSRALQDHSSVLIEYYFKEVCGLMSCYDSRMNPYRTAVSNVWSRSRSLYYIIQSMSAACLSEVSPTLSNISRQLRDAAVQSLSKETTVPQLETSSLLAVVMLGMSLSWHDPSSLGESEFQLLANTIFSSEMSCHNIAQADKQKQFFFYNSLIYWRMLLSWVTDQDLSSPVTQNLQPLPSRTLTTQHLDLHMPHPQTGLGIEVQELVAQVGKLVRGERKRIRSRRYSSRQDIEQSRNAIQTAEELHSKLCAIHLPTEAAIVDSGDEMTPTVHLLKIAEAYRCTGLLQLYRNFPDILSSCASPEKSTSPAGVWLEAIDDPCAAVDPGLIIDTWLTCLALHVLDLVQEVPVSSRSRSIQPFLLVSICSELSLQRTFCSAEVLPQSPVASLGSSPRIGSSPSLTDVLHARRNIVSRLSCFENILAAKPVRQMLILIKDTWAWMDEKREDVYWMDVMIEKGHETLMG